MANIDLNSGKWCELVFEGKNQAFGGYVIRQRLGFRHLIAIIITICAIALAFVLPKLFAQAEKESTDTEENIVVTTVEMENLEDQEVEQNEEIEPIEVAPPPPPLKSSIKFTAPVITADEDVSDEEEIKTQDDLKESTLTISVANVEGVDSEDAQDIADFQEVIAEPEPVEEKPYEAVEQMPQYPGGDAELMKFIYSKIVYPQVAAENGIKGQVILRFVVTKDGSIGDIQVMRSPDPSLSKEAIRVVRMMPRWNPGRQNGVAVPVWFTLPVKFELK